MSIRRIDNPRSSYGVLSRTDQYSPHLCCHCMHLPWGTVVALLLLPPFA